MLLLTFQSLQTTHDIVLVCLVGLLVRCIPIGMTALTVRLVQHRVWGAVNGRTVSVVGMECSLEVHRVRSRRISIGIIRDGIQVS